jgi:hypothetical protein
MTLRLAWCASIVLAVVATTASALPETFSIQQVYANADGTVQFVVIYDRGSSDCDAGENRWAGLKLVSTGPGPQQTFVFPTDLPTCATSRRRMLIATEGFAALGIVAPDYVIPNGFLQTPDGAVTFAGVDRVMYAALPNDGVHAIDSNGTPIQNVATNLAGVSASVVPVTTPAIATVVEYYWQTRDHYFISSAAAEIAALDAAPPGGWMRTGRTFRTYAAAQPGTSPVCRFYLPPQFGDSHYYGRSTAECDGTHAKFPDFVYESPAVMYMLLPTEGVCPAGTVPVYRVFDGRLDANHRYMIDRAMRDQMMMHGWAAEGDGPDLVVMCAPQ